MISFSVGNFSTNEMTIIGTDDGTTYWTIKGHVLNYEEQAVSVNFGPKGGPGML